MKGPISQPHTVPFNHTEGTVRAEVSVTLKQRLVVLAPGLTARAVLEKLATIQMLNVCLPTTDGCWLIMPRYTQSEPQQLLLHQLNLALPAQPAPRIKALQEAAQPLPPRLKM